MLRYKKKEVIVEALQWHKVGDDPRIIAYTDGYIARGEYNECICCEKLMTVHGMYPKEGFLICPSDWLVTDEENDTTRMSDENFKETFEEIETQKEVANAST